MVRPKRFELPFSGIGIRCVIQLRHGRSVTLLYTYFFRISSAESKLSVQRKDAGIEVGRERHPQDIRDLQIGGCFADAAEIDRHRDDQQEQDNDPDQSEEIILPVEENNAPKEIKSDLGEV